MPDRLRVMDGWSVCVALAISRAVQRTAQRSVPTRRVQMQKNVGINEASLATIQTGADQHRR